MATENQQNGMEHNNITNEHSGNPGAVRPKTFLFQRARFSGIAPNRDRYGSSGCCLTTPTGSSGSFLDPVRLLTMQEEARCRKISAEVMKRCLYKPVAPCRRRALNRGSFASNSRPSRGVQSVPATRKHSTVTTPILSPSGSHSFFGAFFSRGTTPRATSPVTPEYDDRGLTSLFRPRPRYVHASCSELSVAESSLFDGTTPDIQGSVFLIVPNISDRFRCHGRVAASATVV